MRKVNCYNIITWIFLILLLEYVSATTEPIITIPNDDPVSQMILSKKYIRTIIMQYLTIRDYFQLTQTNQTYYQTLYVHKPTDILQLVYNQYSIFLTTRMVTDKAEISLWGQYSDILQLWLANTQHQLHDAQLLMFFTPKGIPTPTIQCSSIETDIKGTVKNIQKFFQDHPKTFKSKRKQCKQQLFWNGHDPEKAQTTALAMFYNPLQSTLYFLPKNDRPFHCRVELPRAMVFTHSEHNRIRIARLSKLTGQTFTYYIADRILFFISWFDIAEGDFIVMVFTKTGSLKSIETYKYMEEKDENYDLIFFSRVEGEPCKYISESNDSEFDTINAFYDSFGPPNHHLKRADDYRQFLDTMENIMPKKKGDEL